MKLPIITGRSTKILRTKCQEVNKFDKSLKNLVEDMKETMVKAKGLGIAAPQVGVDARLFLVIIGYESKNPVTVAMVNPEIIYMSDELEVAEEGCLSLPNVFGDVARSSELVVEFNDVKGVRKSLRLAGLDARIVQHEYDHIEGILFVDKTEKRRVM